MMVLDWLVESRLDLNIYIQRVAEQAHVYMHQVYVSTVACSGSCIGREDTSSHPRGESGKTKVVQSTCNHSIHAMCTQLS